MAVNNVSPIFFKTISNVTAVADVEVGTLRLEAGERYVYAYNAGGSVAALGTGMSRPASAFAGLYSGSVSAISGDVVIGFVKHVAIPAAEYGWLLKDGICAGVSCVCAQSAGPKAIGGNGLVATAGAGGFIVGELTSAIVSASSGALRVLIP